MAKQGNNGSGYQISAKVSAKGAVSIYGLQRYPTTLYADQWRAILASAKSLEKFMSDNAKKLKTKDESGTPEGQTAL